MAREGCDSAVAATALSHPSLAAASESTHGHHCSSFYLLSDAILAGCLCCTMSMSDNLAYLSISTSLIVPVTPAVLRPAACGGFVVCDLGRSLSMAASKGSRGDSLLFAGMLLLLAFSNLLVHGIGHVAADYCTLKETCIHFRIIQ